MRLAILLLTIAVAVSAWGADPRVPVKQGLPAVVHPQDNPTSAAKITLGKQLFFDPRLSRNGQVSCAGCHDPGKGWSNGAKLAVGVDKKKGPRGVPTLINVAFNKSFHWDGAAGSLEEQVLKPIQNPLEMDQPLDELMKRLNGIPGYRQQFQKVFGRPPTPQDLARAIAAYERTILSHDAPVDRFLQGDRQALSPPARRGFELFFGQARCHLCHAGPNFSDQRFHNIGIGLSTQPVDPGRAGVSNNNKERGAFKTPTLREIARTAPYMHDGSMKTLEQVVQHYNFGGVVDAENELRDPLLEVLYLGEDQAADLVAFLKEGLSSSKYPHHKPPKLPE